jgi:hypothetical protein
VSDEEIRVLERDATPAGRLKLARALERLGRSDEALDALLQAREDRSVRAEIARYPAWTHEGANQGNTFSIDAASVLGELRLVWTHRGTLDPRRAEPLALQFLATPAVAVFSIARGRAAVHDIETGEVMWPFEHGDDLRNSRAAIAGSLLLLRTEEGVVGRDLYTGEVRWRLPGKAWEVRGGLILFDEGRELVAFEVRDAIPAEVWRREMPEHHDDRGDEDRWFATARRVYIRAPGRFTQLERASGASLATERGSVWCADEAAALCSIAGGALALRPGPVLALGEAHRPLLGPTRAIAHVFGTATEFDRSDARARELKLVVSDVTYRAAALARSILYASYGGDVHAVDLAHGRNARVLSDSRFFIDAVVPVHRRLLTFAHEGTVTCYR